MSSADTNAANWQADDRGDMEKVLAMLVLGLGSLLSGMLPAIISERNRQRFPLTTSLLLCFGAGILLATALVHILPEVNLTVIECNLITFFYIHICICVCLYMRLLRYVSK